MKISKTIVLLLGLALLLSACGGTSTTPTTVFAESHRNWRSPLSGIAFGRCGRHLC